MFIKSLGRFALTAAIMSVLGIGLVDYLQNLEQNECSMTYMMQNPSLIPVYLNSDIENRFPNYNLYLYCEGSDCQKYESLRFEKPGEIPVLFITGNADSHKQVRSLASVGLEKSRKEKYSKRGVKFHYFTISFNEELSALYGPLLDLQTEYSQHCIRHIMRLFSAVKPESKRPKSVLVVGNSMGGVIARGLLVPKDSGDDVGSLVNTIITQATPHNRPVLSTDSFIAGYYDRVNRFWLNESEIRLDKVVIASSHGGPRDILVRSGLSNINEWKAKSRASVISAFTLSTPFVWRSIDHRCMSWCREFILAINRALFAMIDQETGQLHEDRIKRETILRYFLERDGFDPKPGQLNLADGKNTCLQTKF